IGVKDVPAVVEYGCELVGAGGGIDLIVDGQELAGFNFGGVVTVEGFDAELATSAQLCSNLWKLILRESKDDGDGLKLGDHEEAAGVVGMAVVAQVDEAGTHASINRRGDVAVRELQLGVIDLALIRTDGAIELADLRSLRIKLLLGNDAFFVKKLETIEIDFSVLALGLVLGKLAFGLLEQHLERAGIDFDNTRAAVDQF